MAEFKDKKNFNEEKSTLAVLIEILKLLGLLCWKGLKKLWKLILIVLKFLLRWFVKALIFIIDAIDVAVKKIKSFWYDNNTQQKKKKLIQALKKGAMAALKGVGIGLLFLLKGFIWLLKKLFLGIIHIKTNAKFFFAWIAKIAAKFGRWIKKQAKAFVNFFKKIKYNYKSFRRNQGFKGLLLDLRNSLKGKITLFIDNEQEDDDEEDNNNDDEDIVIDTEIEEDDENVSGIKKVGRKIYKAMKNIVDVD